MKRLLVGRERELQRMEASLDSVLEAKQPVLFISGEAGVGKTALVEEFLALASKKGAKILRGNCSFPAIEPYLPIHEALRNGKLEHLVTGVVPPRLETAFLVTKNGLLVSSVGRKDSPMDEDIFTGMFTAVNSFITDSMQQLDRASPGNVTKLTQDNFNILAVHGRYASVVSIYSGRENEFLIDDMEETINGIEDRFGEALRGWKGIREELSDTKQILNHLFESEKYEGKDWAKDDPKARQDGIFENITRGILRLSRQQPVVVFLDDIHWADPSTIALIQYMARNSQGHRLLIVGTYRPEELSSATKDSVVHLASLKTSLDRQRLCTIIDLTNLGKESTEILVKKTQSLEYMDESLLAWVWKETQGNPLFITELLETLQETDTDLNDPLLFRAQDNDKTSMLPQRINEVIQARLSRLENSERNLLDPASVMGNSFESEIIVNISGEKRLDVLKTLNKIERLHRLIRSNDEGFIFSHIKIRDAIYEGLSQELRREYHLYVAKSMSTLRGETDDTIPRIAYHYYMAGNTQKGIPLLQRAAALAYEKYSNDEAMRYLEYALSLVEGDNDNTQRMNILKQLAKTHEFRGDHKNAVVCLERCIALTSSDIEKADVMKDLARNLGQLGKHEQALKIISEGHAIAEGKDQKLVAELLYAKALVTEQLGQFQETISLLQKANEIFIAQGLKNKTWKLYSRMGVCYFYLSELDKGKDVLTKALEICHESGETGGLGEIQGNLGIIYHQSGNITKGLEHFKMARDIFAKIGSMKYMATADLNIGHVMLYNGDYRNGPIQVQRALRVYEKLNYRHAMVNATGTLAEIFFKKGELEKATTNANIALQIAKEDGYSNWIPWPLQVLGLIHMQLGDTDKALDYLKKSREEAEKTDDLQYKYIVPITMARLYLDRSNDKMATDLAQEGLEYAVKDKSNTWQGFALMALGLAEAIRGNKDSAINKFEEAQKQIDPVREAYPIADVKFNYGIGLKRLGDKEKARQKLTDAIKMFEDMGLSYRSDIARKELDGL